MNEDDRIDDFTIHPRQYRSKVVCISETRVAHLTECEPRCFPDSSEIGGPKTNPQKSDKIIIQQNIPIVRAPPKINVKQNIILGEKVNVREVLNGSAPLRFTIRRSPVKEGAPFSIAGENDDPGETTSSEDGNDDDEDDDFESSDENGDISSISLSIPTPFTCKQCEDKFTNRLQLLRHSRHVHKYRKVKMALSEIKKFYSVPDMKECPICARPLKSGYRSAYLKHLHTHTNELYHCCKVCKRKFRRLDHMRAHEKRHVLD